MYAMVVVVFFLIAVTTFLTALVVESDTLSVLFFGISIICFLFFTAI